jgi:hypothetical protein
MAFARAIRTLKAASLLGAEVLAEGLAVALTVAVGVGLVLVGAGVEQPAARPSSPARSRDKRFFDIPSPSTRKRLQSCFQLFSVGHGILAWNRSIHLSGRKDERR